MFGWAISVARYVSRVRSEDRDSCGNNGARHSKIWIISHNVTILMLSGWLGLNNLIVKDCVFLYSEPVYNSALYEPLIALSEDQILYIYTHIYLRSFVNGLWPKILEFRLVH